MPIFLSFSLFFFLLTFTQEQIQSLSTEHSTPFFLTRAVDTFGCSILTTPPLALLTDQDEPCEVQTCSIQASLGAVGETPFCAQVWESMETSSLPPSPLTAPVLGGFLSQEAVKVVSGKGELVDNSMWLDGMAMDLRVFDLGQ